MHAFARETQVVSKLRNSRVSLQYAMQLARPCADVDDELEVGIPEIAQGIALSTRNLLELARAAWSKTRNVAAREAMVRVVSTPGASRHVKQFKQVSSAAVDRYAVQLANFVAFVIRTWSLYRYDMRQGKQPTWEICLLYTSPSPRDA